MHDLNSKVAIITGATGNLGQAVASTFRQAGARCALVARGAKRLSQLYPDAMVGKDLLAVADIDLANPIDTERLADTVAAHFGRIDVLVNTAGGFAGGRPVHAAGLDVWEQMFRINLNTALNACRAVVPRLLAQGSGGRIVNVGARAALSGVATLGPYCAAKSALLRLTETLAAELREHGITVNSVLPGTIDTPQNRKDMPGADFSKWVTPQAIADVIAFLASDAAGAVSGAALPVYGRS